jgi:hypothetical protein
MGSWRQCVEYHSRQTQNRYEIINALSNRSKWPVHPTKQVISQIMFGSVYGLAAGVWLGLAGLVVSGLP